MSFPKIEKYNLFGILVPDRNEQVSENGNDSKHPWFEALLVCKFLISTPITLDPDGAFFHSMQTV